MESDIEDLVQRIEQLERQLQKKDEQLEEWRKLCDRHIKNVRRDRQVFSNSAVSAS